MGGQGGSSYGASLAQSSSSGATQSGATDISGGGNYGGTSHGAGSLLLTTASGFGSSAGGINPLLILGIAVAGIVTILLLRK